MGWNKVEPGAIVFEDAPYVNLVIGLTDKAEILKDRPNYRFPDEINEKIDLSIDVEDQNEHDNEDCEGTEMIIKSLFIAAPLRPMSPMNPFSPIKISIPKN